MKKYLLIIFLAPALVADAQKRYNVLDWKSENTVNTFLVQKMHARYAERRLRFAKAVASQKQALDYIRSVQNRFAGLVGILPQRARLNPKITGTIKREGYRVEKLVYESFKDHHVTANLYVPEGNGKFPAVLLFCGHEDLAKATESYQKTAILFAKNGFVVLVIDPVSQSERYQLTDANGKPLTRGGTTEHTLLNATSNLLGTSLPAFELLDNSCGLDYLTTRSEVDTSRIGCLGNSGGGMQTMYFAAFDKRIKITATCSYLATRDRTMELSGAADGCAQVPGEGRQGLEMVDLLIAAAPKPAIVLAGRYDFIDYTGTVEAFGELKSIYRALNKPNEVSLVTVDDGHGISIEKREKAVTWFRKWMYNDTTHIHEKELSTLGDKALFVLDKPQVAAAYENEKSIPAINRSAYDELAPSRKIFLQSGIENIKNTVAGLLQIDRSEDRVNLEINITGTTGIFRKAIVRKQGQPPIPLLIAQPHGKPRKCILWLPGSGKNKIADSAALVNKYLEQDCTVVIADLRGIGETADKADLNDPKYYNSEYRNAMLALHLGLPMPGQRATDILSLLHIVGRFSNNQPVEVHATGNAAIPAMHALLYAGNVESLFVNSPIASFWSLLENPVSKEMYSNVIPGVLRYYDIPDLIRLLGARVHFEPV